MSLHVALRNREVSRGQNILDNLHTLGNLSVQVEWEEVEPEEDVPSNPSVKSYFVKVASKTSSNKPSRQHPYFRERCLQPLTSLF